MKVLITGGLGWLGKALSEQVSTRHRVCAFDLERPDVERERSEFEGDVLYGSVTDYAAVLGGGPGTGRRHPCGRWRAPSPVASMTTSPMRHRSTSTSEAPAMCWKPCGGGA